MNQAQRTFLIKKIEEGVKTRIDALKSEKPKTPNLSNYLFEQALSGTLQIQPQEVILDAVRRKALESTEDRNWLTDGWGSLEKKTRRVDLVCDATRIQKAVGRLPGKGKSHRRPDRGDHPTKPVADNADTVGIRQNFATDD